MGAKEFLHGDQKEPHQSIRQKQLHGPKVWTVVLKLDPWRIRPPNDTPTDKY